MPSFPVPHLRPLGDLSVGYKHPIYSDWRFRLSAGPSPVLPLMARVPTCLATGGFGAFDEPQTAIQLCIDRTEGATFWQGTKRSPRPRALAIPTCTVLNHRGISAPKVCLRACLVDEVVKKGPAGATLGPPHSIWHRPADSIGMDLLGHLVDRMSFPNRRSRANLVS